MPLKTTQIQALFLLLWPLIVFSIPSEFSIRSYEHDPSSTENLTELFEQWIEKHERIYEHPADKLRGFENFVTNFAFVQEKNSKSANGGGHVVGLNKFADLSNEEFKAKHISKIHMGKSRERKVELLLGREHEESCDAPKSLDWREKGVVTAVKNQGQCGSCWAFSSTGAMEGSSAIATGELMSLSEQELVDCVGTNWGCDGGYMDYAFEWVVKNGGIDTEADYGYTAKDGACNSNKEASKVVMINGYIDVPSNDSALLCAVAKQPVSVGIDASQLDFQLYSGGIFDGACSSDPDEIDHAVLIVGYGSENNVDYWIVKNSWGTNWGDKGYIKIKRNMDLENGTCAINAMASYPTINSVSSS